MWVQQDKIHHFFLFLHFCALADRKVLVNFANKTNSKSIPSYDFLLSIRGQWLPFVHFSFHANDMERKPNRVSTLMFYANKR